MEIIISNIVNYNKRSKNKNLISIYFLVLHFPVILGTKDDLKKKSLAFYFCLENQNYLEEIISHTIP